MKLERTEKQLEKWKRRKKIEQRKKKWSEHPSQRQRTDLKENVEFPCL